jgi:hypothetical protein
VLFYVSRKEKPLNKTLKKNVLKNKAPFIIIEGAYNPVA